MGIICFEFYEKCDDIVFNGYFGWFYDEVKVFFRLENLDYLYLKDDFIVNDFVMGKIFDKVF